jgi:hypothetical protein
MAEMPFPAKSSNIRSEEHAGMMFGWRINELSLHKPFQHLHVDCLINSGPFRHKFKVYYNPDVNKSDKNCFDLGFWHLWLLWHGDSP